MTASRHPCKAMDSNIDGQRNRLALANLYRHIMILSAVELYPFK